VGDCLSLFGTAMQQASENQQVKYNSKNKTKLICTAFVCVNVALFLLVLATN
jgi:hypothetical protein